MLSKTVQVLRPLPKDAAGNARTPTRQLNNQLAVSIGADVPGGSIAALPIPYLTTLVEDELQVEQHRLDSELLQQESQEMQEQVSGTSQDTKFAGQKRRREEESGEEVTSEPPSKKRKAGQAEKGQREEELGEQVAQPGSSREKLKSKSGGSW